MRTVIVYYSMSGNTAYVAQKMSEEIPADLVELVPKKAYPSTGIRKFIWGGKSAMMGDAPALMPYSIDLAAYDRVVFGTPVWASSFAPPLRSFIAAHAKELEDKRIAAFACSAGGDAGKCLSKLRDVLGREKLEAELSLVDPKERPTRENDMSIHSFCSRLG